MLNYARVENDIVTGLQSSSAQVVHDNLIEIGANDVQLGSGYVDGVFTPPNIVDHEVAAIRKISKRSFMQRFTQPERTAIRKSLDDIVIDIYEDLQAVNNVDLDHPDTAASLGYLTSAGILVDGRTAEILVNGSESEL
jgi:hypothetical protein